MSAEIFEFASRPDSGASRSVVGEDLLTLDDIAAIYKCSRWHARDCIVKIPGFPERAPGTSWKKPRWLASDVRQWLRAGSGAGRDSRGRRAAS